jgi:hypothetical protein
MNFGVTSVAAPNAASSSAARYSSTARLVSSGGRPLGSLETLLPVGLGLDQAGIDGKALAADQTFSDAAAHHRLE